MRIRVKPSKPISYFFCIKAGGGEGTFFVQREKGRGCLVDMKGNAIVPCTAKEGVEERFLAVWPGKEEYTPFGGKGKKRVVKAFGITFAEHKGVFQTGKFQCCHDGRRKRGRRGNDNALHSCYDGGNECGEQTGWGCKGCFEEAKYP